MAKVKGYSGRLINPANAKVHCFNYSLRTLFANTCHYIINDRNIHSFL